MARKSNEIKENEELKENVATEATENEAVTSTGETAEEIKGESVEAPAAADEKIEEAEDAKVEENASNTEEDAEVQAKEDVLVANTSFNDKYTATKYVKGTEFVVVDEEIETEKISDKKYKISAKRAEEIKAKGYID